MGGAPGNLWAEVLMIEPTTILAVLLVEDSDDDAELIRRQVCAVWPVSRLHTVGTLRDAALFLDKSQPDVILLDLNLPNGAGVKIVKMIRAIADSALLLVVSVRADLHTAEEAIRNEADGYISKDNITPPAPCRWQSPWPWRIGSGRTPRSKLFGNWMCLPSQNSKRFK
jgi:CheY-like chemotaxis protein